MEVNTAVFWALSVLFIFGLLFAIYPVISIEDERKTRLSKIKASLYLVPIKYENFYDTSFGDKSPSHRITYLNILNGEKVHKSFCFEGFINDNDFEMFFNFKILELESKGLINSRQKEILKDALKNGKQNVKN